MSDTKETDEKKSLSLSKPGRLELKKSVEYGQVRQSFSRGRTKAVAVERVKKRSVGRTRQAPKGELPPEPEEVVAPPKVEAPPPPPPPEPEVDDDASADGDSRGRVVLKSLTDDEKAARAKALEGALKADEEARRRAEEQARHQALEDARRAKEQAEAERRKAEEERRKESEEQAKRKAEEQARHSLGEEEQPAATPAAKPAAEEEQERPRAKRGRAEPRRAPAERRDANRRRSGKMTVTQALSGREERQRSLASVRRAREREKRAARDQEDTGPPKKVVREVVVPETIIVQELANRMAERGVDVIKELMKMGVMATVNQAIDGDTAELIVAEFGHRLRRVAEDDVEIGLKGDDDAEETLQSRAPVVTVMGHVDHGKTSLLDALRETDVATGEAGGITQHIGAYQIELGSGDRITFLDTPGHEAFTAMRARGASVTDIVVLVVAADDGVMPQTIEAIHHAKAADAPIVVAINKVDIPDANPARVRQELLNHELVLEEHGGDILSVEVSAKAKQNLEKLEEAILLQAEVMELRANPDRPAEGIVVEAKVDRGRGPVATVLVSRGTLRVGDTFVAGNASGRVRALIDDHGRNVNEATPSQPVEILGLDGPPEAGDEFVVVENEARAREIAEFRERRRRTERTTVTARTTLDQMLAHARDGVAEEMPVILKADVQGSLEAIEGALNNLATDEVKVTILHSAVGGISESDVTLASASEALIIAFNVRADTQARDLARREGVEIMYYSVIYEITDAVKQVLSGMLSPTRQENFLGNAEIREVFGVSKIGKVGGCLVTDGTIRWGAGVRLLRDDVVVHEGKLASLKRFQDDVREVQSGQECGMSIENYQDIKVGDVIEAFEVEEIARTL
ncbi:MAG: translation initiation factor IF-2 [Alphaproteobacteria bacterium]|nr:translation initiation factor IF-2 [Alphaproteobacteria bacterium]